ncbi:antibiotic biosynthesis monooxygenase [Klebsiella pneumoniae]|nr:antibiotic biosynthesis monooxygenase [Klebsiella pneumoniae]
MSDLDDGLLQGAKGALRGGVEDLAIGSQANALRAAFAHPAFQHRLQQFNLMADCRRADAERLGGLFKTAMAGDGMKGAQRPQRR